MGWCNVPKGQCRRLACLNTSAIYLCAGDQGDVSRTCREVSNIASAIRGSCCGARTVQTSGSSVRDGGWSVWAGYGNCNEPDDKPPTDYPYPGGSPNGLCSDEVPPSD